jgi:DNA-binding response OmpR family regulator
VRILVVEDHAGLAKNIARALRDSAAYAVAENVTAPAQTIFERNRLASTTTIRLLPFHFKCVL